MKHRTSFTEVFLDGSWASLLAGGTVAVMLSWILSGCRIGDHSSSTPPADTISGYYSMTPNLYTASVTLGSAKPVEGNVPYADIPSGVQEIIGNPVAVILSTTTPGQISVVNPATPPDSSGNRPGLTLSLNLSNLQFADNATMPAAQVWPAADPNGNCEEVDQVSVAGGLNSTGAGTILGNDIITGHMDFTLIADATYQGNCTATWQAVINCINDPTQCLQGDVSGPNNTAMQASWVQFFAPYVGANLLTVNEISSIQELHYEIQYQ